MDGNPPRAVGNLAELQSLVNMLLRRPWTCKPLHVRQIEMIGSLRALRSASSVSPKKKEIRRKEPLVPSALRIVDSV